MLDTVSQKVYTELLNKDHWNKTYEKVEAKGSDYGYDLSSLFYIKETDNYKELSMQLADGTYNWSIPDKLLLSKAGTTKKRVVYMYNFLDRYLLGVLYRALNVLYADKIYPNCFSYRVGISTNSAIQYIDKSKGNKKMYGLKSDIKGYFNSVSRQHLNTCLTELFGEDTGIRSTLDDLFNNDTVLFQGEEIQEYKALIPGCALGSFFANYCLRDIDKHFYEQEIVYARYSDDILLLSEDKEDITHAVDFIKAKIEEYGLTINEKKYVQFEPDEAVDYLGLELSDKGVDISKHAKMKVKKTIKRWVKAGRKEIEIDGKPYDLVAKHIVRRLNYKLYKSYIIDERKFGWAYYAFRYITVLDSLTEIDFYLRDQLRYLKTGRHNKGNIKYVTDDDFRDMNVLSLYDMYLLFHEDFDYYCEVAYLV